MSKINIIKYNIQYKNDWEKFIKDSVNGTFLHSREFLEYHQKDKFEDYSLMFYKNEKLIAICPACKIIIDNEICFYSHKGSTFGGIIINSEYYNAEAIVELLNDIENYLIANFFNKICFRQTSELFSKINYNILDYLFYYKGYHEQKELSLFVDLVDCNDNIYNNLKQGKRTNINNCIRIGMNFEKFDSENRIEEFYNLLKFNLLKHNTSPVHSLNEILDLKRNRLINEIEFFGIFLDGKMLAGAMIFIFNETMIAHTQYLAAGNDYLNYSPMSYLYYNILVEMKQRNFKKVSWGIVTEECGTKINFGLLKSKEAFGSTFTINKTYIKYIG